MRLRRSIQLDKSELNQAKADLDRLVDSAHRHAINDPEALLQPEAVNGSNLIQNCSGRLD